MSHHRILTPWYTIVRPPPSQEASTPGQIIAIICTIESSINDVLLLLCLRSFSLLLLLLCDKRFALEFNIDVGYIAADELSRGDKAGVKTEMVPATRALVGAALFDGLASGHCERL